MPIYEYKCGDCAAVNDFLVKNTQKVSHLTCPGCGSGNLSRLISVPGAVMSKGAAADLPSVPSCPNRNCCGVAQCPAAQNS